MCRICHCESEGLNTLLTPCYCAGSLKYVHSACLQQWLATSETSNCELCKFSFIMSTKIKPFKEWRSLEMSGVERRRLFCTILFHSTAALCVVWSLCVLVERAADEVKRGLIGWPFWTKLVVVAVGLIGGVFFMYIQCKQYFHLCYRWRANNRILLIQNAPEKTGLDMKSLKRTQSNCNISDAFTIALNIRENSVCECIHSLKHPRHKHQKRTLRESQLTASIENMYCNSSNVYNSDIVDSDRICSWNPANNWLPCNVHTESISYLINESDTTKCATNDPKPCSIEMSLTSKLQIVDPLHAPNAVGNCQVNFCAKSLELLTSGIHYSQSKSVKYSKSAHLQNMADEIGCEDGRNLSDTKIIYHESSLQGLNVDLYSEVKSAKYQQDLKNIRLHNEKCDTLTGKLQKRFQTIDENIVKTVTSDWTYSRNAREYNIKSGQSRLSLNIDRNIGASDSFETFKPQNSIYKSLPNLKK